MDLLCILRKATTARLINWLVSKTTIADLYSGGKELLPTCYEATIDGMTVKLLVRHASVKGIFFAKMRQAFAAQISQNGQNQTFTSDPKVIPGEKTGIGIIATYYHVRHELTCRNLSDELRKKLSHALHTK